MLNPIAFLFKDGPRAVNTLIGLGISPVVIDVSLVLLSLAVVLFGAATLVRTWSQACTSANVGEALVNATAALSRSRRRPRGIRRRSLNRPPRRRS
ncbi:hypothetical protein ACIP98_38245 [Streptomyces sp. NPDC088354]|uniref:hypothetical protein n=1 Tax=Streptomyces sp. NPDC088354 TaxID=3365856 RepID=UPI003819B4D3